MSTPNSPEHAATESERDSAPPPKMFRFVAGSGAYEQVVERLPRDYHPVLGPSWQADHDLCAYYKLLEHALTTVHLQYGELMCLLDVNNGNLFFTMPGILVCSLYSAPESYFTKWEVTRTGMITLLESFTPCQERAVIDALERFTFSMSAQCLDFEASLKRVGLMR